MLEYLTGVFDSLGIYEEEILDCLDASPLELGDVGIGRLEYIFGEMHSGRGIMLSTLYCTQSLGIALR